MANVGADSSSEEDRYITDDFKVAASRVNMRLKFFLNKLDDLTPADWYCDTGMVPLIPRRIDQLSQAYTAPLRNIVKSCVNKCSKVEAVYIHFGCGGLFEFNPGSKTLKKNLSWVKLELLLRELFQKRLLVEEGTGLPIAHEIRASGDVETMYADLRKNYLKIGCLSGSEADPDILASWGWKDEITGTQPTMFLFGDHLDVMQKKGLVDKFVPAYGGFSMPPHAHCTAKVARLMYRELKKLVEMESTSQKKKRKYKGSKQPMGEKG